MGMAGIIDARGDSSRGAGAADPLGRGIGSQADAACRRRAAGRSSVPADRRDCTAEVLDAVDTPDLVGVEPEIIREYGAVPLPYLRLYLHTC